jgi:hypothetical protein
MMNSKKIGKTNLQNQFVIFMVARCAILASNCINLHTVHKLCRQLSDTHEQVCFLYTSKRKDLDVIVKSVFIGIFFYYTFFILNAL